MTQNSREYAIALFTLGKETGTETEILESLEMVETLFEDNPDYLTFLASPSIPKKERIQAIQELLEGRVQEYVCSFVCLLCEHQRIDSFFDCVENYRDFFQIVKEVSQAHVRSVVELTETQKVELQQKLEKMSGHTVNMDYALDPSLIGGIVVEMDGQVYDGSLKQYLSDIKEVMCQ